MGYSPWGHKESDTTEPLSAHNMLSAVFIDQFSHVHGRMQSSKQPYDTDFVITLNL